MAVLVLAMSRERARAPLIQPRPAIEKVPEAQRLPNLVLNQRPETRPPVHYWRAVGYTHARLYDEATAELRGVLDPGTYLPNDGPRREILFSAPQLALHSKPELAPRAANPQLANPGRRLEAVSALQRHLNR